MRKEFIFTIICMIAALAVFGILLKQTVLLHDCQQDAQALGLRGYTVDNGLYATCYFELTPGTLIERDTYLKMIQEEP